MENKHDIGFWGKIFGPFSGGGSERDEDMWED
jgi:hypothetical protein